MRDPIVTAAVATLCEGFNRTATPATFAAYEIGLAGVSPPLAERAARIALQRCRFMPTPAELREIAITNGTSYESVSEAAFAVLQRAVAKLGPDRSVNFADGAINCTVRRLGGWQRVCAQPREEFGKWFRRDFKEAYTRVIREGCDPSELRYLAGRNELVLASQVGKPMPGGGLFSMEQHGGGGIQTIGVRYSFLLPSPAPVPLVAAAETLQIGVKLKTLEA